MSGSGDEQQRAPGPAPKGRRIRRLAVLAAGAATLFLLLTTASACPDGTGMHAAMHGTGERPEQTPVAIDSGRATVLIQDFDFSPRMLSLPAGAEVTWVNKDSAPHDATDGGGAWGTGMLRQGEEASVTFRTPGSYTYRCTIHPAMTATLEVT